MADFSGFRISPNVEDRQNEVLPRGVFGGYGLPENVFNVGDGTMSALNASTDFVPQPSTPSPLSIGLGINSLPNVNGQPIFANKPQGLYDSTPVLRADIDPALIDAIKGFEGYSATPAWDYKQHSSGYGTVAQPGDTNIPPDQLKAIHEQRLHEEVAKAADAVDNVNPNLPPGVRNALISLTYNAGPGWAQSGLGDAVRAGDMEAAKTHFLQYNKAGGEVNPGLVSRRSQEATWFGGMPQGQARTAPATSGVPLNGLVAGMPPQAPPIFPQQAQAAPQEMAAAPSPLEQIPQAQAPPIFYAPRKPINLSALRAALSGNKG